MNIFVGEARVKIWCDWRAGKRFLTVLSRVKYRHLCLDIRYMQEYIIQREMIFNVCRVGAWSILALLKQNISDDVPFESIWIEKYLAARDGEQGRYKADAGRRGLATARQSFLKRF